MPYENADVQKEVSTPRHSASATNQVGEPASATHRPTRAHQRPGGLSRRAFTPDRPTPRPPVRGRLGIIPVETSRHDRFQRRATIATLNILMLISGFWPSYIICEIAGQNGEHIVDGKNSHKCLRSG